MVQKLFISCYLWYVFSYYVTTYLHTYLLTYLLITYLPTYLLIIYLLMYLLTPCSRVLREKPTGFQLVKNFSAFYGTRRFITLS
jgi:hypothetical protein